MSRHSVRLAVTDFLAPPAIANVQTVYRSAPGIIQGQDWQLTGERQAAAVLIVHINDESERVIDFNGAGGYRMVDYTIGLLIRYKSMLRNTEAAVDTYDQIVQDLKDRIRSDPRLGTSVDSPPYIFMAGMGGPYGPQGAPDLQMTSDLPRINKGSSSLWIWGRLDFRVSETNYPIT